MAFKLFVQNLSKSYQNLNVLDNISLNVKNGEFVSIIGPSGCGKSTLFNIISGIENETAGKISINGREVFDRAGQTGYMPQSHLLLPWRTVEENVMLGLEIRQVPKEIAKAKTENLLKIFGLDSFAKNYPETLSGGMKQRVSLLRTVLFHDDFLLLDEPFGALDALTRVSLQTWLMELWEKMHSSILFITHDIREAIFLSDRILVLSKRPAKIVKEMKVLLPRPRKLQHLASKKALNMERELLSILFDK